MADEEVKVTRKYPLGFGIEGKQIVTNAGKARPATNQEIILWNQLRASGYNVLEPVEVVTIP